MAIRIIEDGPTDVTLTRSEYERLHREYTAGQSMTTSPQSFEAWVRARKLHQPTSVLGPPPWIATAARQA